MRKLLLFLSLSPDFLVQTLNHKTYLHWYYTRGTKRNACGTRKRQFETLLKWREKERERFEPQWTSQSIFSYSNRRRRKKEKKHNKTQQLLFHSLSLYLFLSLSLSLSLSRVYLCFEMLSFPSSHSFISVLWFEISLVPNLTNSLVLFLSLLPRISYRSIIPGKKTVQVKLPLKCARSLSLFLSLPVVAFEKKERNTLWDFKIRFLSLLVVLSLPSPLPRRYLIAERSY